MLSLNEFPFPGVAALVGFGKTLASAKKHDPTFFSKGMTGELGMVIPII